MGNFQPVKLNPEHPFCRPKDSLLLKAPCMKLENIAHQKSRQNLISKIKLNLISQIMDVCNHTPHMTKGTQDILIAKLELFHLQLLWHPHRGRDTNNANIIVHQVQQELVDPFWDLEWRSASCPIL
jgi:hypothetical protein